MTEKVDDIQVLVFNIMGVKMGVDTEQVYGMRDHLHAEGEDLKIARFHEKIPFRITPVIYRSPKILLIRDDAASSGSGIIVDEPEDIVSIPIDSIRPLPPLLELLCPSRQIWGTAIRSHADLSPKVSIGERGSEKDEIILLVDFYRLLNYGTKEVIKTV